MPQAVRHKSKRDRQVKPNLNKHKDSQIASDVARHYREISLFTFLFIALYLFISLLTYDPLDLGWGEQHSATNIQNVGGRWGAIFADNFFNWFGYFAYLFSFLVAYIGWFIYQNKHLELLENPKKLIFPSLGFILTLSAGCGLAIVHFAAESVLLPSHAGGVLGNWIGNGLKNVSNAFGATLFLLIVFFAGFSMMTKLSWLTIMDVLGAKTLKWLPILAQEIYYHWLPKLIYYSKVSWHWLQIHSKKIWAQSKRYSHQLQEQWRAYQAQRAEAQAEEMAQHYLEPEPVSQRFKADERQAIDETVSKTSNKQLENSIEQQLRDILLKLNIQAHIRYIQTGPTLLHIELQSDEGQAHSLLGAQQAIAKALAMPKIRLYETAPEQIVLEIPNPEPETIDLNELLEQKVYINSHSPLMLALGKDISGHPVIIDLARIPHLLLGGQQPSDIERILDNMILSLLHKNAATQLRLLLFDAAAASFNTYHDLPQLLCPVIPHDSAEHYTAFNWCVYEMERRYQLMNALDIRNIENYNDQIRHEKTELPALPYIVIIVREIEVLWQTPQAEDIAHLITDLVRKARSAGIHLLLATNKPEPSVISDQMKINFPSRIAAQLQDKSASQELLGRSGAEYLLGDGDMLYLTPNTTGVPARLHAANITADKAQQILAYARALGKPHYQDLRDISVSTDT